MKIYIVCAVRNASVEAIDKLRKYADTLRTLGHEVHYPPDDAPQDDKTGEIICATHLSAMKICDEVHVFWDVESRGSHFDIGMAYALGKRMRPIECINPDGDGKSYWKVLCALDVA